MAQNIDRVVEHLVELNGSDVPTIRIWPELEIILTIVDREEAVPPERIEQIVRLVRTLETAIPAWERTRVSKWLDGLEGKPTHEA